MTWTDYLVAERSAVFGAYQVFKMIQFTTIFGVASTVSLTHTRIAILRMLVSAVLIAVCLGITLTFFGIVPTTVFGGHLPFGDAAGPWSSYISGSLEAEGPGLGTIGYNHAYVAAQVLLLLGITLVLFNDSFRFFSGVFIAITLFATFLSGSRAGIATIVIFIACTYLHCLKLWHFC